LDRHKDTGAGTSKHDTAFAREAYGISVDKQMAANSSDTRALSDELAQLVDAVQDYAIFLLGPEGDIRSWNRGASRIMGYSADEVIGRHFSIFYTEEDKQAEKPRHELETALAEGRVEDEGWRLRKNGDRFWTNTIITPMRDKSGGVMGFAKVTRDLTERRHAEEQLRRSEEIFRLLVSSVQDYAIFMLDKNGYVETWNAGARRIKGYEPEEIIGRHFSTFYPEEEIRAHKPERELEIATETGRFEETGLRLRKDGTRFWANVLITAVRDAQGNVTGFAKVTRDVTEQRRAEDMRRQLLVSLDANRAKDEFLMTLSHELRTPMTAILGWSRLLPTLRNDETMFADALASITRSAQVQARLIDDVLDVSRIVSGKLRLTRENVDIEHLLNLSIDGVRSTADAKGITITTKLDPSLGAIYADPTRLQQVMWNLLTNALKFTPARGRVELSATRSSDALLLAVADSGEGIDPDFLPYVFEPFKQAENPRTRVHGGLGLGLSIVRYLTEAHGGTVTAESAGKGKGARFTIALPTTLGAPVAARPPHDQSNLFEKGKLDKVNILIVDDDREGRHLTYTVLHQAGADVVAAESAQIAIEKATLRKPELIITDIAMPGMDGYELARSLRTRDELKDVRIIALTAFPERASDEEKVIFDKVLTKPIEPADLVNIVAREVGRT
jgi:PAS domain S-box-containing protein